MKDTSEFLSIDNRSLKPCFTSVSIRSSWYVGVNQWHLQRGLNMPNGNFYNIHSSLGMYSLKYSSSDREDASQNPLLCFPFFSFHYNINLKTNNAPLALFRSGTFSPFRSLQERRVSSFSEVRSSPSLFPSLLV